MRHIVTRKNAQIADVLGDAKSGIFLDEESRQPLARHFGCDVVAIDASPREVNGGLTDVRPENLDAPGRHQIAEIFHERNGDRIDLFARGATRDPHADGIFCFPIVTDCRKHMGAQAIE